MTRSTEGTSQMQEKEIVARLLIFQMLSIMLNYIVELNKLQNNDKHI